MIKRIVKLTFQEDKISDFVNIFEESKILIRNFPGCQHVELLQNKTENHIFFTFSFWESEAALEAYRHSDLFRNTWSRTKILFAGKPEAWSVDALSQG